LHNQKSISRSLHHISLNRFNESNHFVLVFFFGTRLNSVLSILLHASKPLRHSFLDRFDMAKWILGAIVDEYRDSRPRNGGHSGNVSPAPLAGKSRPLNYHLPAGSGTLNLTCGDIVRRAEVTTDQAIDYLLQN
jgi:hypothetical protein